MTVVRWRPLGQGLEPRAGVIDLGDIQSEMDRLFGAGRSGRAFVGSRDGHIRDLKEELVIKGDLRA